MAVLAAATGPFLSLRADDRANWREWSPADGTQESYTRTIGLYPGGDVALRHGIMKWMDLLDGYEVRPVAEPREGLESGFATAAPVYSVSPRHGWTVEEGALKEYRGDRWVARATPGPGERMLAAIPGADRKVFVLFTTMLAAFDAPAGVMTPLVRTNDAPLGQFVRMARGTDGAIWIAADRGIGVWTPADRRWHAFPSSRLEGFDFPHPAADGELLVAAAEKSTRRKVVVRLAGGAYTTVFTSNKKLRGWRAADGVIWILEGASIWRLTARGREAVNKRGALAGVIYDVATEPGGGFWIASSVGAAHYLPAIWRTPDAVAHIDQPVHGIVEDRRGRLWFSATEYLLELDGASWRIHPLPDDIRTQTAQTASLAMLDDGRIAFTALEAGTIQRVIAFDPQMQRFDIITHPEGRQLTYIWARPDGNAWVHTSKPCRIDIWDGRTFRPRLGPELEPLCDRVRYLHESSDRSIWVGTTALAGGVLRPTASALTAFGAADGYPEAAVYTIADVGGGRIVAGGRDVLAELQGTQWTVIRSGLDAVRSVMPAVDGSLWVASGSGVHRRHADRWIVNSEDDGLASTTAYKIFQDSRGRIWAGTSRGISRYYPEADRNAPRAFISKGNPAETPPGGDATITFSGFDRWKQTASDRLLFSYRMDDGPWSPFQAGTEAPFTRLKGGGHQFALRAMDRNGNVSATETFAFAVALPWYRQAGFYGIVAVAATAIVLLIGFAATQYRELARAKRAAELASESKTSFLANMSHEIRTPMNGIMAMTDLAFDLATHEEQKEYLGTVRRSSASLMSLLNDILDLAKVEAGKLQLAPTSFDLHECVTHAISTFRIPAAQRDLDLRCRIDADVPRLVIADDLRVRQVLLNLLGNAVKFTEQGHISVTIRRESPAGDPARIRISVADTGVGIAPDKQALVFAPFEQADGSTTRKYGGTGLGLTICSELTRLMGGAITVESPWLDDTGVAVQGSAFHVTLALPLDAAPPAPAAVPTPEVRTARRILVAEDNPVNQMVAKLMLQKLGHSVTIAADGQQAVDLFERESPDLILMDVQMPVLDGFEATKAIRSRPDALARSVPIIAMTAHAMNGYRQQCLDAGMTDYVTKPVRRADLVNAIARATADA